MSQANPKSGSEEVQNNEEEDQGIVITNGPDGLGDEQPTAEAEPDAEAEADIEADGEPEVEAGTEAVSDEAGDVDGEDAADTPPESEDGSVEDAASNTEVEAEPEVDSTSDPETDPDIDEGADVSESNESATETDTEVEPEVEAEDGELDEGASEVSPGAEVEQATEASAEAANTSEENDNSDSNMSETESEDVAESTSTESGGQELSEVSGTPTGFEATIKAEALQGLIDSVDVLVEECKIRLSENRVGIRAVDPANVGMVDVDLEAEAFESFHTSPGILGLNLEKFADVVSLGSKDDLVHLNFDAQTRKLHIGVDGVEYTLALIDPDSIRQEPDIPDLDLPVEVTLESDVINQGVTASDMVSDHIALGTQQDGEINQFVVEAEGDTDDVELVVDEGDEELIDGTFGGKAHSLFSLDYLKDMNRALPKNGEVTLELGDEYPVKIHFDNDDNQMHTTYMLAPRIQSD